MRRAKWQPRRQRHERKVKSQAGSGAQARSVRRVERGDEGPCGGATRQAYVAHACGGVQGCTGRYAARAGTPRAKPNAQAALLINLVKRFPDTVERLAAI